MKRKIHLICNAHLDPVWQWEWEEGAAAAVSTFRSAANLCEEFEGFVFNHNEALLYKWVEEYEPKLFERIRKLVGEGRWNIIGGWFVQPDCNMPCGESFVRQILSGRKYFKERFGVRPHTAVNFDSFGHTRGLVQILVRSGYDSYLYMRPENESGMIPNGDADFIWVGFDGSQILAHKLGTGYNSLMGRVVEKARKWMDSHQDNAVSLLPWGVGNHGGGPSRKDLREIAELINEEKSKQNGFELLHSTPSAYFEDIQAKGEDKLLRYTGDLNPRFTGCYTSLIRIKQKHRKLENDLYMTEKMLSAAAISGLMECPQDKLDEAQESLMLAQFHDILPGSSVQPVEEAAIRMLDHGLEIVSRLKAKAFFALSSGQKAAADGEYPILVYNPHPYTVKDIFECEFMLADQNWSEETLVCDVYNNGRLVKSQTEKENSNIPLNWRKRVVFEAELKPSRMNRFDCKVRSLSADTVQAVQTKVKKSDDITGAAPAGSKYLEFSNGRLEVAINCETGLIDKYCVAGREFLKPGAFKPLVIKDDVDSWGVKSDRFNEQEGEFALMPPQEGNEFSGLSEALPDSVRIIEDGEVRTVVEALFKYNRSFVCMRYKIPRQGSEMQVELLVYWLEKDRMLKLDIPTTLQASDYYGQVAYGRQVLPCDGTECVAQKWTAVVSGTALTVINDGTYASDFLKDSGRLRLTLLRSSGYCAYQIEERETMPQDRFSPRMDQGERRYDFWINAGNADERLEAIETEALIKNEKPYALSMFPSGEGELPGSMIVLEDKIVQMTALKKAEDNKNHPDSYIIRLFEPTGKARTTVLHIHNPGTHAKKEIEVKLGAFEIRTYLFDVDRMTFIETDLMEDNL